LSEARPASTAARPRRRTCRTSEARPLDPRLGRGPALPPPGRPRPRASPRRLRAPSPAVVLRLGRR
jgi:hypothetical protein